MKDMDYELTLTTVWRHNSVDVMPNMSMCCFPEIFTVVNMLIPLCKARGESDTPTTSAGEHLIHLQQVHSDPQALLAFIVIN